MSEQYAVQAHDAFIAALQSAAMTGPDGQPLFDPSIFQIDVSDGSSINNSNGQLTLPLTKIYICVGLAYGSAQAYTDDLTYTDEDIQISFQVISGTNGDQMDTLKRLDFARRARSAAFSAEGLSIVAETVRNRRLAYSLAMGLVGIQHTWQFRYGVSTTA